ncbi:MAG: phosphotransferase [Kiritimatiellae bacterium]|nr:phosphotransferase [Kiritimatiellia bacterium]
MKDCEFSVDGLRALLEERLGGGLRRFEMVTECSRPENFRVETASGERLLVKCVPPERGRIRYFRDYFLPHLVALRDVPCAVRLSHGPWDFGGCVVVALAWCAGGRVMPDRLTPAQEASLVKGYAQLSDAMQRAGAVLEPRDNVAVRAEALRLLSGPGCGALRRFVERDMPSDAMSYDPKRMKVIHGDFHHGNVHFDGDALAGVMDFEDFRTGYPADDWVRYVVCGAEHLKWFDFAGRRRLLALFARLLPLAPADEWREAVDGLLVRKIWRRFSRRKGPAAWLALNLRFRLGFYMRLRALIAAHAVGEEKRK